MTMELKKKKKRIRERIPCYQGDCDYGGDEEEEEGEDEGDDPLVPVRLRLWR